MDADWRAVTPPRASAGASQPYILYVAPCLAYKHICMIPGTGIRSHYVLYMHSLDSSPDPFEYVDMIRCRYRTPYTPKR